MTMTAFVDQNDSLHTINPARLDFADDAFLDGLPFAVIGMTATGEAEVYNKAASGFSGIKRSSIIGQPFFLVTGACMNNYLVAQRYLDEPVLDVMLDYVLTFHMRPTPVKLRLLKRPGLRRDYLLIQR